VYIKPPPHGLCPEPDESSLHLLILFFQIHSNIIFPINIVLIFLIPCVLHARPPDALCFDHPNNIITVQCLPGCIYSLGVTI
jgi:hypothetical protein